MPKPPGRYFAGAAGLFVFCAFAGLVTGLLLFCWEVLKFELSISLGQIVQTGALLVVFLLTNHVYAKSHDSRKKKVEILVGMVDEILTQAQQANSIFHQCAGRKSVSIPMRTRLDSALRGYSNAVNELAHVLEHSGQSLEVSGFEKLRRDREEYKNLVTESPYPISLPVMRIPRESKLYSKIRSNLRKFQMDLAGRA